MFCQNCQPRELFVKERKLRHEFLFTQKKKKKKEKEEKDVCLEVYVCHVCFIIMSQPCLCQLSSHKNTVDFSLFRHFSFFFLFHFSFFFPIPWQREKEKKEREVEIMSCAYDTHMTFYPSILLPKILDSVIIKEFSTHLVHSELRSRRFHCQRDMSSSI